MNDETLPGLVLVNTGDGKGKTTAALGAALRALSYDWRVLMIQFIKGKRSSGERQIAAKLPGLVIRAGGLGLIRGKDPQRHRQKARDTWQQACREVASDQWDLVILDEIFLALGYGFVSIPELVQLIQKRPPRLHLILTGRGCPPEIMELADTVTEMRNLKHHLQAGVSTRRGIEY